MNLQELQAYLEHLMESLQNDDQNLLRSRLKGLVSGFPFNKYEYILTFLVDRQALQFSEYETLRQNYVSSNRYLDLFGLAPRIFGQKCETHLMDLDSRFKKPNRSLDPHYDGQYDLWLEGIRVEVKASRATNTNKPGDLVSKALHYGSTEPFWMNYQQLKSDTCDVFVFIGVWVDQIRYWVLSTDEVKTSHRLSHQHRGGVEYQIGITNDNIAEFEKFRVDAASLVATVISKRS